MIHPELTCREIFKAYEDMDEEAENPTMCVNLERLNDLASAYMSLALNLSRVSEQLRDNELRTGRIRESIDKLL
jgi:hypothetical protein